MRKWSVRPALVSYIEFISVNGLTGSITVLVEAGDDGLSPS